jgi:hypothetical protein
MTAFLGKPSSDPNSFSSRQRRKRMGLLAGLLRRSKSLHVLDLGGTVEFWESHAGHLDPGTLATLEVVNLEPDREVQDLPLQSGGTLTSHVGDSTHPVGLMRDSYDLVFSNSVMEHVGNLGSQKKMADAVRSLGRWHFVQTPSRRFPIETHFHMPFFAFLPLGVRTTLHQRFSCGFMGRESDWLKARLACEQTRLLSRAELAALFPQSRILAERVVGFVKSWMVTNIPE